MIPVFFYFAWSLWYALTQRERLAVPAPTCGTPFGCLAIIVGALVFLKKLFWMENPPGIPDEESFWYVIIPGVAFLGCLCTSCFVIEHHVPVILLGLVQMALGLCAIILFSFTWWLMMDYAFGNVFALLMEGEVVGILVFIAGIFFIVLINLPNLYVGACLFMVGWQGGKEAPQCSPEPAADGGWIGPCGTRNAASSRFCTGCGTPKPEQPGALEHTVGKQAEYPTIEKGDVMA